MGAVSLVKGPLAVAGRGDLFHLTSRTPGRASAFQHFQSLWSEIENNRRREDYLEYVYSARVIAPFPRRTRERSYRHPAEEPNFISLWVQHAGIALNERISWCHSRTNAILPRARLTILVSDRVSAVASELVGNAFFVETGFDGWELAGVFDFYHYWGFSTLVYASSTSFPPGLRGRKVPVYLPFPMPALLVGAPLP